MCKKQIVKLKRIACYLSSALKLRRSNTCLRHPSTPVRVDERCDRAFGQAYLTTRDRGDHFNLTLRHIIPTCSTPDPVFKANDFQHDQFCEPGLTLVELTLPRVCLSYILHLRCFEVSPTGSHEVPTFFKFAEPKTSFKCTHKHEKIPSVRRSLALCYRFYQQLFFPVVFFQKPAILQQGCALRKTHAGLFATRLRSAVQGISLGIKQTLRHTRLHRWHHWTRSMLLGCVLCTVSSLSLAEPITQHLLHSPVGDGMQPSFSHRASVQPSLTSPPDALLFISFSMPEALIESILKDAHRFHIKVVIRGLINNDFRQTLQRLFTLQKKIPTPVLINPLWFETFSVDQVPTLVVTSPTAHCQAKRRCEESQFEMIAGSQSVEQKLRRIMDDSRIASLTAKHLLQRGGSDA